MKKYTDIIQRLPVIDIKKDTFMDLNTDLSEQKLKGMIGKNIIYRVATPEGVLEAIGLLFNYEDSCLIIKYENTEEFIQVSKLRAIEEYTPTNSGEFSLSYLESMCKITNVLGNDLICLITNITKDEIEFQFKVIEDGEEVVLTGYYLKYLIKKIIKL